MGNIINKTFIETDNVVAIGGLFSLKYHVKIPMSDGDFIEI